MHYSYHKFSTLSSEQIKTIRSLTITNSGMIRYLDSFIDAEGQEEKLDCDRHVILLEGISLIGWAMVGTDLDSSYNQDEGVIYLFINYAWRSGGMGSELFNKALDHAKELGYGKVFVYAHDPASERFFNQDLFKAKSKQLDLVIEVI